MNFYTLEEITDGFEDSGIFSYIIATYEPEFLDGDNPQLYDNGYFDHSAEKCVTRRLVKLYEANDKEPLTQEQIDALADLIWFRFKDKWERLAEYDGVEYNPIDNYSMVQVETPNIQHAHTGTVVLDDDTTNKNKTTTKDKTYAFNSDEAVNTNESEVSGEALDNVGTQDTTTTYDELNSETGTRRLTRSGNIGVTTSAQMLEGDVAFWTKWNFIQQMYKDIDTILCLSVY